MQTPTPPSSVAVRDVLPLLGFVNAGELNWSFKSGGLEFGAVEGTNQYFQSVMSFAGHWAADRSMKWIEFSMPTELESIEQAVAWIVNGIGSDYVPVPILKWFEEGKTSQHLLPWERERRRRLQQRAHAGILMPVSNKPRARSAE